MANNLSFPKTHSTLYQARLVKIFMRRNYSPLPNRQQLHDAIPVDHGYKFDATMQALKIVTIYRDL